MAEHTAENDAWAALEGVREVLRSVDINSLDGQEFERMWAISKIVSRALAARVIPPGRSEQEAQ